MKKILVPTDLSEASVPAIELALAFAGQLGALVELVYVIDTSADPYSPLPSVYEVESPEWRQAMLEQSRQALHRLPLRRPEAVSLEFMTTFGDPVREILSTAERERPELIVMSMHSQRSLLQRLLARSISESVVRESTRPVLTVRTASELPVSVRVADGAFELESSLLKHDIPRRLLVPVDLTWESIPVLQQAGALAIELNAELSLVYVAEVAESVLDMLLSSDEDLDPKLQVGHRASDALKRFLEQHSDRLPRRVLDARRLVGVGKPAREIVGFAIQNDSDLIVIGTRSGADASGRMGSVTERVLQTAPCPVLTVPQ